MPVNFFDSKEGNYVRNEFVDALFNERKIKLKYLGNWYEFCIKTVEDKKANKSYIKTYTCTDSFIDELARNGYGLTFSTELYNNVEEVGTFMEKVLEDSVWYYAPEYNWGDFTEYIEEKLFKIPVSQFKRGIVKGYELNYMVENPVIEIEEDGEKIEKKLEIINPVDQKKRPLEIGDDLSRDLFFWDQKNKENQLLGQEKIIENDGYIYVFFSQLDFCYTSNDKDKTYYEATEEAQYYGNKSYALAPNQIDPTAFIQFIAFPQNAEIQVDEKGLLLNKNYHYLMTVKQWNEMLRKDNEENFSGSDYFYQFSIPNKENQKYFLKKEDGLKASPLTGNWTVYYEGYLMEKNGAEIEFGKKISISDRTEINISENIDQYVTVYQNSPDEFQDMWVNPDGQWKDTGDINYRICSVQKTQQVIPQIAKNLIGNGTFIKSVDGWEAMSSEEGRTLKISLSQEKDDKDKMTGENLLVFEGIKTDNSKENTALNFGMIASKYQIKKGQTYCLGVEGTFGRPMAEGIMLEEKYDQILIGEGEVIANGEYNIKENPFILDIIVEEDPLLSPEENPTESETVFVERFLKIIEFGDDYISYIDKKSSGRADAMSKGQESFIKEILKKQKNYLDMSKEERLANLNERLDELSEDLKIQEQNIKENQSKIVSLEEQYPFSDEKGHYKKNTSISMSLKHSANSSDSGLGIDVNTFYEAGKEYKEIGINSPFEEEIDITIALDKNSVKGKIEEEQGIVINELSETYYYQVKNGVNSFEEDTYTSSRIGNWNAVYYDLIYQKSGFLTKTNSVNIPHNINIKIEIDYTTSEGSGTYVGVVPASITFNKITKYADHYFYGITYEYLENNQDYINATNAKKKAEKQEEEDKLLIKNVEEAKEEIDTDYDFIKDTDVDNEKEQFKLFFFGKTYLQVNEMNFSSMITQYYLIQFKNDISNPYFAFKFFNDAQRLVKRICFFEAYTKGQDQYNSEAYFNYSGRFISEKEMLELDKDKAIENDDYVIVPVLKDFLRQYIMFEEDILPGTTYPYLQYFIQQVQAREEVKDTFQLKEYLMSEREDLLSKNLKNLSRRQLPYSRRDYTEEDLILSTKYLDMSKCSNYLKIEESKKFYCKKTGEDCLYQKLGYCPFLLKSEKSCRRIRTLNEEKSNKLSLTQKIGEKFEIYPIYDICHDANGKVKRREIDNLMEKRIYFLTQQGNLNNYGFRYKENLKDITRNLKSDQIVSKLYVEDTDSQISKTGICSIKTAEDNVSRDSFILDFSYYTSKNILDKDEVNRDLYGVNNEDLGYLKKLGYLNKQYDHLSNLIINLSGSSFAELSANITVLYEGITTSQQQLIKLKKKISYIENPEKNKTYQNYIKQIEEQEGILSTQVEELLMDDRNQHYFDEKFYENNIDIFTEAETKKDYVDAFLSTYSIFAFKETEWVKDCKYFSGMLGQYNKEFLRLKELKKKQSKLLYDINLLSLSFYAKYEPYIKEGIWSKNDCLTDNAYYQEALQVSAQNAIPKVEYSINVINNGYIYNVGDLSYVEDKDIYGINKKTGLPNKMQALISEITYDLDLQINNVIKVQNYTSQFEDLFSQISTSVQSLSMNEGIYKRSSNFTPTQGLNEKSLQTSLDQSDVTFIKTPEDNLSLDSQGQQGTDINNHTNKYKLNGQGLFFSNNGGQTWSVGVGPGGINADYIKVGSLDAGKVKIVDNDYLYFYWDKSGIVALRKPEEGKTTNFSDFCCYNKTGLSLVENGKIRLRSGYEFNGSNGTFDTEEEPGGNIGFYLYDRTGRKIFYTETESSTETQEGDYITAGRSGQILLAGEICTLISGENGNENGACAVFIGTREKQTESVTSRLLSVVKRVASADQGLIYQNLLTLYADGNIYVGGKVHGDSPDNIKDLPDNFSIDGGNSLKDLPFFK